MIDIESHDSPAWLNFGPDPDMPGNAIVEAYDGGGHVVVGSFKIRDLLTILHAMAGTMPTHEEKAPSRRPIWMGGRR